MGDWNRWRKHKSWVGREDTWTTDPMVDEQIEISYWTNDDEEGT